VSLAHIAEIAQDLQVLALIVRRFIVNLVDLTAYVLRFTISRPSRTLGV
jgi:hypothetical protein